VAFVDDFDLPGWSLYDSPGHNGQGRRSPGQISVRGGVCTITGTPDGTTGGMKLRGSKQYGVWSVRLRTAAGSGRYHPVVLLWAEGGGSGVDNRLGEIDFVEVWRRPRRDRTQFTLHSYGTGRHIMDTRGVAVDMTRWHTYHVRWTPTEIVGWVDDDGPYFRSTDTSQFPQVPMELCIQLDWFPDEPFPDEPFPDGGATMEVDRVEII
jgi:licheninase